MHITHIYWGIYSSILRLPLREVVGVPRVGDPGRTDSLPDLLVPPRGDHLKKTCNYLISVGEDSPSLSTLTKRRP